ncbi:heterokaryon incompatibility protein-domain-containing protein [Xylaria cubensis]|nr:heterokaryon incompatibility protein-domain-containing protein [Xylaria cubensis]
MFEYRRLDLGGSGFRLVRLQKGDGVMIECELIHTTLDDNVIPYEAVSYTWGTLKRERHIYVTGEILPVTSNLWQVLHDLRCLDVDRYLWVDGVCINQDDDLERGHQVQQMKYIYQRADRGIFYLSPCTTITQVIMRSLTLLQKQVAGNRWAPNDERWNAAWQTVQAGLRSQYDNLEARQTEGLAYLLLSPFFRRVWILQEVASVRRASIFCGTCSVLAHIFAIVARIENATTNAHILAVIDLMQKSLDNTLNLLQGKSIASLLVQFRESESSDERDRIYALLGLCEAGENAGALTPDYTNSLEEVVQRTLRYIYGDYISIFLSHLNTIPMLLDQLEKPSSTVIEKLLKGKRSEDAFCEYINATEGPIELSEKFSMRFLGYMIDSYPIKVLRKFFARLEKQFIDIPHGVVSSAMDKEWFAEILELLCQYGRKVFIPVVATSIPKIRNTKILKMLIESYKAKVSIDISMRGLWIMFLLSDNDTKALIPLIHGIDRRTEVVVPHLRAAASQSAGSFGNRDAVMTLCSLAGDIQSGHDDGTTPIRGGGRVGPRRRMSLNSNQVAREYEGTAKLTSPSLSHHFSGRPINVDSQLGLSPAEKWRPGMSNFNCHGGVRGRSQSI